MAPSLEQTSNVFTGSEQFHARRVLLDLTNVTKSDLKAAFENSYDLYETLFSSLTSNQVFNLCPDRLRLPLIFYYGHTAVVYMNKLILAGLAHPGERIDLVLESLFETGVDEMSWDDTENHRMGGSYVWPLVEETREYRREVREFVYKLIDRTQLRLPIDMDSPWWSLLMGINHELIHFETSSVLIRQFPVDLVRKPESWIYGPIESIPIAENEMVLIPETSVCLGKPKDIPSFGWDNEYGQMEISVAAFYASKFLVTNEEFFQFVLHNGYERRELWSDEGWHFVQFRKAKHPFFWRCPRNCLQSGAGVLACHSSCSPKCFADDELARFEEFEKEQASSQNHQNRAKPNIFKLRVMFDDIEMPANWPCEVNFHEAKAFCEWKKCRLMSEAEHHAMRDNNDNDSVLKDVVYMNDNKINHNLKFGSPTPVNFYRANKKGLYDVFGNVWQWCADHANGLQLETHYLYDDYSSNQWDGRHNMLVGGSWASMANYASQFCRNYFRRHFYQHSGFRMVRSVAETSRAHIVAIQDRIYQIGGSPPELDMDLTQRDLILTSTANEQLKFDSHLCPQMYFDELTFEYTNNEWFNPFMAAIYSCTAGVSKSRVLHIGSSGGRVSFELTKLFDKVLSVDYSSRLLMFCLVLQKIGRIEQVSANNSSNSAVLSVELNEGVHKENVLFKQFSWLPNEIQSADLVLFTMIDRVNNPIAWLARFRELVNRHGMLIIYSKESTATNDRFSLIQKDFSLIESMSISSGDLFTVWKFKTTNRIMNMED